jgi:hypothetical protein
MDDRKDLLAKMKEAKATGRYPPEWFKGYTKLDTEDLVDILAGMSGGPKHPVPAGTPTTPEGYPVTVQVLRTVTVEYRGNPNRTFHRGSVYRGEHAWELWDNHRSLVAPFVQ